MVANIAAALIRIKGRIEKSVLSIKVTVVTQRDGTEAKLHCQLLRTQVKIEVNTTMRGHVAKLEQMPAVQFKLANIRKLKTANAAKHAAAFEMLRAHLHE